MAKGTIISDTFEKLAELGQSTTKKAGQAVNKTLNPLQILERQATDQSATGNQNGNEKNSQRKDKHTPLDFETLDKKYQKSDEQKQAELRNRLFQLVKSGEKEASEKVEQDKQQKEQTEHQEQQEKKKKQEERMAQEQQEGIPHGKEKKSIFAPKKRVQKEHAEYKPSSGKS